MDTISDRPEHRVGITGAGSINGVSFDAQGAGSGNASTGAWDFSVEFSEIPRKVDPFANLLGILILPTSVFGREEGDATNLLSLAGGVLEFTQTLRGDQIAVDSVGTIKRNGERELHWHSEARGDIQISELASVEPFDVVMLPQGPGKVTEVFALPFLNREGRSVVHALRQLTFTPRADLPSVQFRKVMIYSTVQAKTVKVRTMSVIRAVNAPFRVNEPGAAYR